MSEKAATALAVLEAAATTAVVPVATTPTCTTTPNSAAAPSSKKRKAQQHPSVELANGATLVMPTLPDQRVGGSVVPYKVHAEVVDTLVSNHARELQNMQDRIDDLREALKMATTVRDGNDSIEYKGKPVRKQYRRMQPQTEEEKEERRMIHSARVKFGIKPIHDAKFDQHYNLLKQFKEKNGHTNVAKEHDKLLHYWVSKQRSEYKNMKEGKQSALTQDRIQKLNNLGFVWRLGVYRTSFETRFQQLQDFVKEKGHCNVPHADKEGIPSGLGHWVAVQRMNYKDSIVRGKQPAKGFTRERREQLEALGFQWQLRKYKT